MAIENISQSIYTKVRGQGGIKLMTLDQQLESLLIALQGLANTINMYDPYTVKPVLSGD